MNSAIKKEPERLSDPLYHLLSLSIPKGERYIIGLAGYPGSGKSTFCAQIAKQVEEARGMGLLTVLGMDGFHLYKEELSRMEDPETAFARRGAPFTFNPELFIKKLRDLRASAGKEAIGWPEYEHGVGDPAADAVVVSPDCRVVMVEGIYTLYREGLWASLEGLFDETWFLDVPIETAMERICLRHQKAWGFSEKQARQRADKNDRLNCGYISPGRENADWLV